MGSFEFARMGDEGQEVEYEEEQVRLDDAFNRNISDMKPFVMSLPNKEERQRLARWIKKLCAFPGPKLKDRKNRNLYSKMLLLMLRRGFIDEPFLTGPPAGKLPIIPAYMSVQLGDSLSSQKQFNIGDLYPGAEWIMDELASADETAIMAHRPKPKAVGNLFPSDDEKIKSKSKKKGQSQNEAKKRRDVMTRRTAFGLGSSSESNTSLEDFVLKENTKQAPRSSPKASKTLVFEPQGLETETAYPFDDDYGLKERKGSPGSKSKKTEKRRMRSLNFADSPREEKNSIKKGDSELDLQNKILEAKFEEEKLVLQQKHDLAVRKILERKKVELEDVKAYFKRKITTMEELNRKYEKQVSLISKDLSLMKERNLREIEELKETIQQNVVLSRHEKEKEVHDTIAAFEQEKYDLQKHHGKLMQEFQKEMEERMKRMEAEHSNRLASVKEKALESESEKEQLKEELKSLERKLNKQRLEADEFQKTAEKLSQDVSRLTKLNEKYEKENRKLNDDHDHVVRTLRKKAEKTVEDMKKEHSLSANQATSLISELENKVADCEKVLQDAEYQSKKNIREMETSHNQEVLRLEVMYDKKIRTVQREKEELELDLQSKVQRLENQLSDKEQKITQLQEQMEEQAHGAEKAINDFKVQAENHSRKICQDLTEQAEKLEAELHHVRREKELKVSKLEEVLTKEMGNKEQEVAQLKSTFEEEKNGLHRTYQTERESILQEHQKDRDMLVNRYEDRVKEREKKIQSLKDEKAKMSVQFESQLKELREEVINANTLRKQQLVELGLLREEEKQSAKRQEESSILKFQSQLEQQRLHLQKLHKEEIDSLLERTNAKLKDIETEYEQKSAMEASAIAELQRKVIHLETSDVQAKTVFDSKLSELNKQFQREREELTLKHKTTNKSLQQDIDLYRIKNQQLERKCQQMELESKEQIASMRLNFEEKMRGLMPTSVQKEFESTISSLKEQITVLQARVSILHEQLDSSRLPASQSAHEIT